MHGIEDPDVRTARCMQHLLHMRNTVIRLGHSLNPRPNLTAFRDAVVVGIAHQESGCTFVIGQLRHGNLRSDGAAAFDSHLLLRAARAMLAAYNGVSLW